MEAMSNGKGHSDEEKNHHKDKDHDFLQQAGQREGMSHLQEAHVSSAHIETRRKLQSVPLVSGFEQILESVTISDEDKEILRRHYLKGQDFRLIGDAMGYSERTIKARHKSALRKISSAL